MWETDRQTDRKTEDSDCYIDPYLLNHVDSIFRALRLCFLDLKLLTEFHRETLALPPGTHWPLSEPDSLIVTAWISSVCPTDRSVCGHAYIYSFITPTHSFLLVIHVICLRCSLVYTIGISCLEIPNWQVCQRLVYNKTSLILLKNCFTTCLYRGVGKYAYGTNIYLLPRLQQ